MKQNQWNQFVLASAAAATFAMANSSPAAPGDFTPVPGGDFTSTIVTNGSGDETSLAMGWYAREADDGINTLYDWTTGNMSGTNDILTQTGPGSARVGQFFINDFSGTGYSLDFELEGTAEALIVSLWGGTLAASPDGLAFKSGSDNAPDDTLVDGTWTTLVDVGPINGAGLYSYPIPGDIGSYDVMVIRIKGNTGTIGTTWDNVALVSGTMDPPLTITEVTKVGSTLEIDFSGKATTDYKLTESVTLGPTFTDLVPPEETTTDGSGNGTLTLPTTGTRNYGRVEEK